MDITRIVLDVASLVVVFVAIVRIITAPADYWTHAKSSKAAWIIASIWFAPVIHGIAWPIAALLAIRRTRRNRPRKQAIPVAPPPLPLAEGVAEDTATCKTQPEERL